MCNYNIYNECKAWKTILHERIVYIKVEKAVTFRSGTPY